jgi:hypothetical protein
MLSAVNSKLFKFGDHIFYHFPPGGKGRKGVIEAINE